MTLRIALLSLTATGIAASSALTQVAVVEPVDSVVVVQEKMQAPKAASLVKRIVAIARDLEKHGHSKEAAVLREQAHRLQAQAREHHEAEAPKVARVRKVAIAKAKAGDPCENVELHIVTEHGGDPKSDHRVVLEGKLIDVLEDCKLVDISLPKAEILLEPHDGKARAPRLMHVGEGKDAKALNVLRVMDIGTVLLPRRRVELHVDHDGPKSAPKKAREARAAAPSKAGNLAGQVEALSRELRELRSLLKRLDRQIDASRRLR